jgi:(p)ppGpp synthase/HD superfamily hydrolase
LMAIGLGPSANRSALGIEPVAIDLALAVHSEVGHHPHVATIPGLTCYVNDSKELFTLQT